MRRSNYTRKRAVHIYQFCHLDIHHIHLVSLINSGNFYCFSKRKMASTVAAKQEPQTHEDGDNKRMNS